ncbi:MAG: glycosyltransferase family 39 protein [Acidobacteria bacterium]|nr:glycosyltransferase family 39 protein [Acidobacteriota bacterium]
MSPRFRFWLLILALILFSRMFQTGVIWPEETLYLAVAQQIRAGHTLYFDIWFDKPPFLAWFYYGVFRLVGYSIYGLRLVGAIYIWAVTLMGYALARRLWGEPAGRWTAFFLAFFTGFYIHAATVALAADLLLVLPHLAVFYFLACGRPGLAGLCAGLAFHFNAKALFVLGAAAGWILLASMEKDRIPGGAGRRLSLLLAGFFASVAAGLAVVVFEGGWRGYVDQVWRWGWQYASSSISDRPWVLGLERTWHYLGFHAALVLGAVAYFLRRPSGSGEFRRMAFWMAVSFLGVILGARFFPRYYFQILPPLAVAAGAGWAALPRRLPSTVVLAVALAVPAVRFGRVNLWLALRRPFPWRDTAMDADSRRVGADVAQLTRPTDRILVWGYRPEIYYYARRAGASRFLESQPLTGVLADRHLQRSDPFLPEWAARHRQELAQQLSESPPAVIVDGLGSYNPSLAMENYPELRPALERYRLVEVTRGSLVYRLAAPGS